MARNLRRGDAACKRSAARPSIELLHAVTSSYVAQRNHDRILPPRRAGGLAAGAPRRQCARAMPRLERERCVFRPPRGDKIECYTLVVAENRANPKGQEVRLKVAVLKAKRPLARRSGDLSRRRPGRFAAGRLDRRRRSAGRRRLVERHRRDPPPPRRHHHQPARRRRLDAQSRLLRGAHLGAGARQAPRRDRAAGARDPAALPRRLRQAQDRSRRCTPRRRWPTTSPTS